MERWKLFMNICWNHDCEFKNGDKCEHILNKSKRCVKEHCPLR